MKSFLFILLLGFCAFGTERKINIAVTDLSFQGLDQSSAIIISDRLRTEIVKNGSVSLMERNAMQEILKEQGFQQTGCTSDACAVQMGQLLGVSYMITGSIGKLGKLFTLDLRLIDIATGKILYSENIDCKGGIEDVLTSSVPKLATKVINSLNPTVDTVITPVQVASPPAKKMKNPVLKVTFGGVTLLAAGAGVLCDQMLKNKIKENADLKQEYTALGTDENHAAYQTKIDKTSKDATQLQLLRNACFGVAGACGIGFVLTFVF